MRCLIVDDHPLTRDGTAIALRAVSPEVDVLHAGSLDEAFRQLSSASVQLVLLDLDLQDSSGLQTLRDFREWCDTHEVETRVVVLSAHSEPELVREVVDEFVTGYILKATPREIFHCAIALTLAGGVYIPDAILQTLCATSGFESTPQVEARQSPFTARESDVAALLIQGMTYKRIARELERIDGRAVSEHTIRVHVGNIAWKLGVTESAKSGVMSEIARRKLTFARPVC